jgi:hypothetical protein
MGPAQKTKLLKVEVNFSKEKLNIYRGSAASKSSLQGYK